ncbi:MAG: hypothetical protein AAB396_00355 [Patescibacteria group bacterium]
MDRYNSNRAQSLIEIIIGISIAGILVGGSTMAIALILRSNFDAKTTQTASFLASEYSDNISSIAESNWLKVYCPPDGNCSGTAKGIDSKFYLNLSGSSYSIIGGTASTIVEGRTFTRYFYIENVSRDSCGIGDISANATTSCAGGGSSGVADDPSTQKITVKVDWEGNRSVSKIQYLSRSRNFSATQSNWSNGSGQEGPITSLNNSFSSSSNIDYFSIPGSIKMQNVAP